MSNSLGDSFPYEHRKELADKNFIVGSVFKVYDKIAQKEKRLILIGFRYDKVILAFLRINSEINKNIFPTEELKNEHLELEFDEELRPFLDKTSFVDCSTFWEQNAESVYNRLLDTPSIHLGVLCDDDLLRIKHKVSISNLLSPSQKKHFGLFFSPKI